MCLLGFLLDLNIPRFFVDLDGIVEHVAIGSLHQFVPWSEEHLQSVLIALFIMT